MSAVPKFGKNIRELRVLLCQKSASSKGVREFIEKYYVPIKKANPQFPILIRECSGIQPKVFARYGYGKELNIQLSNESAENVLKHVKDLSVKNV